MRKFEVIVDHEFDGDKDIDGYELRSAINREVMTYIIKHQFKSYRYSVSVVELDEISL